MSLERNGKSRDEYGRVGKSMEGREGVEKSGKERGRTGRGCQYAHVEVCSQLEE